MLITTLAFAALTAVFIALHLARRGSQRVAEPAARRCPRCAAGLEQGSESCAACGAPLQAFELALAPIVRGGDEPPGALHAVVRADVCVGCGTCVEVCPEAGAIRLVEHRAIVSLERCKGHARCVAACPVGAIGMSSGGAGQRLEVPEVDVNFETNVPGLYVVGELGGRGLIKNAVNEGKLAVEHVARRVREARAAGGPGRRAPATAATGEPELLDLVIVGSGPAGLSAGLEARRSGLRYLILEQGTLADTIARYPRQKLLFSEPLRVPLYGDLWVADASKEELLRVWQDVIAKNGLEVRTHTRVESVSHLGDVLQVRAGGEEFLARHVVLALGRRGTPRRLGVPGEELPHVFYDVVEMDVFAGQPVLVVGGGDSAVESALGLANQPGTRVTLSYRGAEFARIKARNREKLDAASTAGRVTVMLESEVLEIQPGTAIVRANVHVRPVPADTVIVRIGGEAPYPFLERCGVNIVRREVGRTDAEPSHAAVMASALLMPLLLLIAPAPAAAQVSPGPLASAHRELDGSLHCFQCHVQGKAAGSMDGRCLDCHREIGWLRAQRRGLHARVTEPCAKCHPDHGGRDFQLIAWSEGSPERFDHGRAGWTLEGKHASLACRDCHQPKLRRSQAAVLAKRARPAGSWIGLERECASCHDDPHRKQLGADCAHCHDANDWKPAPRFDHARSRYPLTGAHVRVECDACHRAARLDLERDAAGATVPRFRPLAHAECGDCHRDPHATRFGAACSRCHSTGGFHAIDRRGFDHSRTRFALRGAHATVACERCHDPKHAGGKSPAFATCGACHRDAHAGQATLAGVRADCAACHDESGYRPSTFTAERHRSSSYPLEGAHASAECEGCHLKRPADAATLGSAAVVMRPRHGACADCHADPHAGRFTARAAKETRPSTAASTATSACLRCHDMRAFRPTTLDLAAHETLGFPLRGAHRAVPCAGCHAELQAPPAKGTLLAAVGASVPRDRRPARPLRFDESRSACGDCHRDPHGSQFDSGRSHGVCDACHGLEAFAPAVRFDHQRDAAFKLEGAHAQLACAACHATRRDAAGRTMTVYRPLGARCADCHRSDATKEEG